MSTLNLNVLDQLNNLVIVINRDTSIEYISSSASELLGFDKDVLLGEGWWNYTKETQQQVKEVKLEMHQLFQNSFINNEFERKITAKNGDIKWVLWKLSTLNDDQLVGIGNDITKRKNLELQVEIQNQLLEERNNEILESITYASNIQSSLLPNIKNATQLYKDAFLLYKPKDLVSGDFYWQYIQNDKIVTAIIDCTGHGVPGALVTIMANAAFNDIVQRQQIFEPDDILFKLDIYITEMLNNQSSTTRMEGMDVSICTYEKEGKIIKYSGAYRPLYLIRDGELIIYEGSKNPIGYYFGFEKNFQTQCINVKENDTLYMFSDGYTDQFGGEKIKKFNRKRFKSLLFSIQEFGLAKQQKELEIAFHSWKGKSEQIDDVSIVGLRI